MEFSNEEFQIMVDQLLYREPISYEMLCDIAQRTLRNKVFAMCAADETLRGRGYEEDVMQAVYMRLMNVVIFGFLLREGVDGPVNNDPAGFRAWMISVATNIKKDFANSVRRDDFKTVDIDSPGAQGLGDEMDVEERQARVELLKNALDVVLRSQTGVYKVLTWLAFLLFMLEQNVPRTQVGHLIVAVYSRKTLFEMYDMLRCAGNKYRWMELSQQQKKVLSAALNKPWDEGKVYGEATYREFFMKKGGSESVSDWVHKMNKMIRRELQDETPDS